MQCLHYNQHHKHRKLGSNHEDNHQALDLLEEVHGPVVRETYKSGVRISSLDNHDGDDYNADYGDDDDVDDVEFDYHVKC